MGCTNSTEAHKPQTSTPQSIPNPIYSPPRGLKQGLSYQTGNFNLIPRDPSIFTIQVHDDNSSDWVDYIELKPLRDQYWIEYDNLTIIRPMESNYLKTSMGNWKGESVLIKSIDLTRSSDEITKSQKSLIAEITSMVRLDHPNIVKFLGFNLSPIHGLVCVTEYMDCDTLRGVLDNPRISSKFTWYNEKIDYAIDVCSALVYMHNLKPSLIHRNIKASKVLLSENRTKCKLSGFGVSRERTFMHEMTCRIGDIEWSAPELLIDGEDYTEKVDVYSFGVLMTELDTCELPFADEKSKMQPSDFTNSLATGALRLELSYACPAVISRVIKSCLQQDPHIRPTSNRVLEMLLEAKTQLQPLP